MAPRKPDDPGHAARWATHALILLAGIVLLSIALGQHPIGDYHAESDFYGGYAEGAKLLMHGHLDPARYPVVGPVYEMVLSVLGRTGLDLFTLAKWLSVISACAALAFAAAIVRRRTGAVAALWLTALIAANPVFMHYGYVATTDMLALAFSMAALCWLISPRANLSVRLNARAADRARAEQTRDLLIAGLLAALAALTRYSNVLLVPFGVVALTLWPRQGLTRGAAIGRFLAGFAILAVPWTAHSMVHGLVPGAPLLRYFSFYASSSPDRSIQDLAPALPDSLKQYHSLAHVLAHDGPGFIGRTIANVPKHLALDARDLIGRAPAVLMLVGLVLAAIARSSRGMAPLWIAGVMQLVLLAPVFHSPRYALPLIPAELSVAALALAWPWILTTRPRGRARGRELAQWGAILAGLATLTLSAIASVKDMREERRLLPTEVIEAGRALRADAGGASRVMSRKGHIGYYANVRVVPFPRVATLAELATEANRTGADFLYYSWYEAQLRPEFAWLLDTTSAVPGLDVVHVTTQKPSVLYRLGHDFGIDPPWLADPWLRRLHEARALAGVLPDSLSVPYRITLGVDALDRGNGEVALELADQALHLREDQALAWFVRGRALLLLGRKDEAAKSFQRALAIDPEDNDSRVGLAEATAPPDTLPKPQGRRRR